jgi:large subunit ribosomal protein L6
MSRIGKQPVPVPAGVKVEINGQQVKVSGKKGALLRTFRPEVEIVYTSDQLQVKPKGEDKRTRAFWGMSRSLLNNMVIGVSEGFVRRLLVEGVGYRASVSGRTLTLNVGYSKPVEFILPEGIDAEVDKNNVITLRGIDKELVGLTAARIREVRKPEPYKGKGIRYEDEYVARKAGKAGAAK